MNVTFPNVELVPISEQDVMGMPTEHRRLPCLHCMVKGECERHREACKAEFIVRIADIVKYPVCRMHAEEYRGDKR